MYDTQRDQQLLVDALGVEVVERAPVALLPVADDVGVERDAPRRAALEEAERQIGEAADVTSCVDFQTARDCLLKTSPHFLISHLRLGAYNGLHLAHLAAHARLETRCLLYDEPLDVHLRESLNPRLARCLHVLPLLLAGVQSFF